MRVGSFSVIHDDSYVNHYQKRQEEFLRHVKFIPDTTFPHIVAVPAMPKQGTNCGDACTCLWEIHVLNLKRRDYNCYWVKGKNDNCDTCIVRSQRWSPIRIRKGEVMYR